MFPSRNSTPSTRAPADFSIGAGEPGREIQQPMAVVILGGIVTSTFLNMIVIPALYPKYGAAAAHAPTRNRRDGRELAPTGD
jgi:hypothetical protein